MHLTEGRHLYSLELLIKDLLTRQTAMPAFSNFCVCYERIFLVLCMRKIYATLECADKIMFLWYHFFSEYFGILRCYRFRFHSTLRIGKDMLFSPHSEIEVSSYSLSCISH